MDIMEIISREDPPVPWAEGEKIPWSDPKFSRRMLKEHLTQAHDAASRRFHIIDQHVAWIHKHLLHQSPGKILDLGCGPGLYTSRLAKLGHQCVGIDYSPASIDYAREFAIENQLDCEYVEEDLRKADFGKVYDLVMMIFGEFNVFHRVDAKKILEKAGQSLAAYGKILLEVQTLNAIKERGEREKKWFTELSGLFSDRPYLCLEETYWNGELQTTTERFYVINALTGQVARHSITNQGYNELEYRQLLNDCGFTDIEILKTWGNMDKQEIGGELMLIIGNMVV